MALAVNTVREFATGDFLVMLVNANVRIFKGAAVSVDASTGMAKPLAAGDVFAGFAAVEANNLTGAAGAITVTVRRIGTISNLVVSGVTAVNNVGSKVYASDDGTFTTVATGNSLVGKVRRSTGNGAADVDFNVLVTA